jgi:glycosyltransferase involved in cell wall biosynthesis
MNPTLAVVVTSYNHSNYIEDAILSLLCQKPAFDDIIVVDDGSSAIHLDNIERICERYNVVLVKKSNGGVASARNYALSLVETDYVVFLDDDDYILDGYGQFVRLLLAKDSIDVFCFSSSSDNSTKPIVGIPETNIHDGCYLTYCPSSSPGACVFRRQSLEAIGGFDETLAGADDFDVLTRLNYTGVLAISPTQVLFHRLHQSNLSKQTKLMSQQILKSIARNYRDAPFDTLIRLSYWYGDYGPIIVAYALFRVCLVEWRNIYCLLRFTLAYIAGRTVSRLS